MLPVLTSPLGSKKAIFSSFSTLYCFRASAKDSALDGPVPLATATPFKAADADLADAFFDRTRSAQDFGTARAVGEAVAASSTACDVTAASGCVWAVPSGAYVGVACGAGGGVEVVSDDAVFGLAAGMFGRAGTIGTAVRVSFLVCATALNVSSGAARGCGTPLVGMTPASDGAWEVTGVSWSDVDGTAETVASDWSTSVPSD